MIEICVIKSRKVGNWNLYKKHFWEAYTVQDHFNNITIPWVQTALQVEFSRKKTLKIKTWSPKIVLKKYDPKVHISFLCYNGSKEFGIRPLQQSCCSTPVFRVDCRFCLYPKEGLKNQTILKCVAYSKSLNKIKVAISARSKCYLIVWMILDGPGFLSAHMYTGWFTIDINFWNYLI